MEHLSPLNSYVALLGSTNIRLRGGEKHLLECLMLGKKNTIGV